MEKWLEQELINAEGSTPTQVRSCEFNSLALKPQVTFTKF